MKERQFMKKKLITIVLTAALLLAFLPSVGATDGDGVLARLEYLQTQPGYRVGDAEYNCYTFVQRIVKFVYEINGANINYHGDYVSSNNMTLVGRCYTSMRCSIDSCGGTDPASKEAQGYTIGKVTVENVRTLISRAMPGDVLQGHRGFNVHTMIIESIQKDTNGNPVSVTVYHGNVMDSVQVTTYSIEEFVETYGHALSVYRATNYYIIDSGTSLYFDGNGGTSSYTSKFVDGGSAVGTLPAAQRAGYTFDGWYDTDGSQYTESRVPLGSSVQLTARWSASSYNVTFDGNGGTAETSGKSVTFDSSYGSLPDASREGYEFGGWALDKKGARTVTRDTTVATARDHSLYAVWIPNNYTIDFDATAGTLDDPEQTMDITFGAAYGALPVPVNPGFLFLGWSTDAEGVNIIDENTNVFVADDHTLYAQWIKEFKGTPTGFEAVSAGTDAVSLKWNAVADATSYEIYKTTLHDGVETLLTTVDASTVSYTDADCAEGTSYSYSVRAVQTLGTVTQYGANTAALSVTTDVQQPSDLQRFRVSETAPTYISLSWSPVDGATGYEVWRSNTGAQDSFTKLYITTSNTTTNTGLERGTTYYYMVRAIREVGDSSATSNFTDPVNVTTRS